MLETIQFEIVSFYCERTKIFVNCFLLFLSFWSGLLLNEFVDKYIYLQIMLNRYVRHLVVLFCWNPNQVEQVFYAPLSLLSTCASWKMPYAPEFVSGQMLLLTLITRLERLEEHKEYCVWTFWIQNTASINQHQHLSLLGLFAAHIWELGTFILSFWNLAFYFKSTWIAVCSCGAPSYFPQAKTMDLKISRRFRFCFANSCLQTSFGCWRPKLFRF